MASLRSKIQTKIDTHVVHIETQLPFKMNYNWYLTSFTQSSISAFVPGAKHVVYNPN